MSSQFRRNTNFKAALGILADIQKNGQPDPCMDKETLRLWIYTLAGMGYIRKQAEGYMVTEKGRKALRRRSGVRMVVSA